MERTNHGLFSSLMWVGAAAVAASAVSITCAYMQSKTNEDTEILIFESTDERVLINGSKKLYAEFNIEIINPDDEHSWEVAAEGISDHDKELLGTLTPVMDRVDDTHLKLTLTLTEKQAMLMKDAGAVALSIKDNGKEIATPTLTIKGSFESDNWEGITTAVAEGGLTKLKQYAGMGQGESFVGMTKSITINGKQYETRVIGEEDDKTETGAVTALTFQFMDSIGKSEWGADNSDFINSTLNQNLIAFSTEISKVIPIKTVSKYVYTNKSSANAEARETYQTSLFPLAISEITDKFQPLGDDRYAATPMSYSYNTGWRNDERDKYDGTRRYDLFAMVEEKDDDSDTALKQTMKSKDSLVYWIRSNAWTKPNNNFGHIIASGMIDSKTVPAGGLDMLPCFCI